MLIELFLLDDLLLNLLIVRLAAALLSVRPPLLRQTGAVLLPTLVSALAAYRFSFLAGPLFRLPLLAVMACAQPFKGIRGFAAAMGATLFSTLVTGGAVMALALITGGGMSRGFIEGGISLRAAVAGAALASFLPRLASRIMSRRVRAENAASVVILHKGLLRRFCGMVDTGSSLTEPVSGLPVVVIRCRALKAYAKRPIPIVTAAGRGELWGFRPERVSVNGREVACFAAVTEERLSAEAIVPPVLLGPGESQREV